MYFYVCKDIVCIVFWWDVAAPSNHFILWKLNHVLLCSGSFRIALPT